jgi:hypothetical protein
VATATPCKLSGAVRRLTDEVIRLLSRVRRHHPAGGQGRGNLWFTAAFFACIASCTAAVVMSGPGGGRLLGTVAAVIGALALLVPLANGAINLKVTTWILWIVTGLAISVLIWAGYSTQDAALSPAKVSSVRDGTEFSIRITAQAERKYLRIVFDVKQVGPAQPFCGDDLRFSVRLNERSAATDVLPGEPQDVLLGSSSEAGPRQIFVSVRDVIPKALCTVDVSIRGSLHGRA